MGVVSLFMMNSGKDHWNAVKMILIYLRGTSYVVIFYKSTKLLIKGFVDFDFGGDRDG